MRDLLLIDWPQQRFGLLFDDCAFGARPGQFDALCRQLLSQSTLGLATSLAHLLQLLGLRLQSLRGRLPAPHAPLLLLDKFGFHRLGGLSRPVHLGQHRFSWPACRSSACRKSRSRAAWHPRVRAASAPGLPPPDRAGRSSA
ncbi:hypothetical protein J7E62_07540 [Variovorax paradoxus]|nr:hypothetical protein [Variovorax paradoxus]